MLGFDVSERTVSRYLRRFRRRPRARQNGLTFLRNHSDAVAAFDFFVVFSAAFKPLCVWFVIEHARRRILHVNVTEHPTSAGVIQNLREAFPFESAPKHLIFDRDSIFSAQVADAVKTMGTKPVRTAFANPWQNGTAERWISSARRDLLDRVVIVDERHLLRLLREYVRYHHDDRTHLGLAKDTPAGRTVEPRPSPTVKVVALPRLGGLHHRCLWREAASPDPTILPRRVTTAWSWSVRVSRRDQERARRRHGSHHPRGELGATDAPDPGRTPCGRAGGEGHPIQVPVLVPV
ncbi:MAG: DDE-type integrase/transposase/recombinase [Deltaproteobacteria bacterium]|nr:DDE-type integrase/transposase/recombinase [Deltaproteobacteria bacterium]